MFVSSRCHLVHPADPFSCIVDVGCGISFFGIFDLFGNDRFFLLAILLGSRLAENISFILWRRKGGKELLTLFLR